MPSAEFITDSQLYRRVILDRIFNAKHFVWIATSDIKDMHVRKNAKMVPFLAILSDLIKSRVSVRLIHAKEPGPNFRNDFDRYPNLIDGIERLLCPRVHFKSIVVDAAFAYTGSANLTGAGLGAKSPNRRNFEAGIITTDDFLIDGIMKQFDEVWTGSHCKKCGRKQFCADFLDMNNR